MILGLIEAASLLLALSMLQGLSIRLLRVDKSTQSAISGVLSGVICIIGMMAPIEVIPGVIFDARSVILSLSALFGGPVAGLISATMAGAFRMWLGGGGAAVGVAVTVSSMSLGLAYWYCLKKGWVKIGVAELFVFGVFVHAVEILLFTQLPSAAVPIVMANVALPLLLSFTVATILLGLIWSDIERRFEAETLLKKSESRLSHHIENTPLGAMSWDEKFICTEWNKAAERIFGYTSEEAIGQHPIGLIIPPSINDDINELYHSLMDRRGRSQNTNENITKDGRAIICDWYNTPIVDENGKTIGVTSLVMDVTDRKQAEKALKESEAKFRSIFQSTCEVAILTIDENNNIATWNPGAERAFGYREDEILGQPLLNLIPPRYQEAHAAGLNRARDNKTTAIDFSLVELRGLHKDGHEFPLELSIGAWRTGNAFSFSAIIIDITERKRTENKLVQSAKMATIGEMAAGITHELNQPMNIMRMTVEATKLRIQRDQADIGQLSKSLDMVEDQIIRMSDIITHMNVYSRQDSEGHMPFDATQSVRNACKLFALQFNDTNVCFDYEVPNGEIAVLGHSSRLEQVVLNLLNNARDAVISHCEQVGCEECGYIHLSMREDKHARALIITVEDNGGGIPDDIMPHIFAPFVTSKNPGHGTGLGLSISFGIIAAKNGTIEVANGEDGACFTITLPIIQQEITSSNKRSNKVASVAFAGATQTVLVVDDEIEAAHALSDFLQELGYLVYTAYNGEEALHIFESDPVDIVITDIHMPIMGGEELTRRLREYKNDLPIFVMTGQAAHDRKENRRLSAATEVWQKPLSLSMIAKSLQAIDAH